MRPTPDATALPLRRLGILAIGFASAVAFAISPEPLLAASWVFTNVTAGAGVSVDHTLRYGYTGEPDMMSGGCAVGDVDGDGDDDLFVIRGDEGPSLLFRNRGDGTFEEVGASAGLSITSPDTTVLNGAAFADLDGNGALDLVVGGVNGAKPRVFLNNGTGHFTEATAASGITSTYDSFSMAFGDYDHDGRLDAFFGHWNRTGGGHEHLWRNLGGAHFADVGGAAGVDAPFLSNDKTFTPTFADLDGDGWQDLLVASDFGTTRVFRNRRDGTFQDVTNATITDENGMGSAVGDFNNDGVLDWFISSIWDPDGIANGNWGITGNRLYRGRGDGTFDDVTTATGVRQGYWGWGSCMADFNNDGWLDIFHVNGMPVLPAAEFHADPARLFVSNGNGTFTEQSVALGVADTRQGRGVACFDYDRDGDIDIFVQNNLGPTRLFRNDGGNANHWLTVRLRGTAPNTFAVGARVFLTTPQGTQLREITAGSNYLSSNPMDAHFGLGALTSASELRVRWPDGSEQALPNVAADRTVTVVQGAPASIPVLGASGLFALAAAVGALGLARLRRRPPTA